MDCLDQQCCLMATHSDSNFDSTERRSGMGRSTWIHAQTLTKATSSEARPPAVDKPTCALGEWLVEAPVKGRGCDAADSARSAWALESDGSGPAVRSSADK